MAGPALRAVSPASGGRPRPVPLPALNARVTDLTNTLDATQRGRLEAQLAAIDRSGPRADRRAAAADHAARDHRSNSASGLPTPGRSAARATDNGLIVIVAKDDRRMRIEVGYGLEGARCRTPSPVASSNERMAPAFRQGDFFGGLQRRRRRRWIRPWAAHRWSHRWSPPRNPRRSSTNKDIPVWAFIFLVGSGILNAIFGLFGSLLAAGIGGWLGFMFFGNWQGAGHRCGGGVPVLPGQDVLRRLSWWRPRAGAFRVAAAASAAAARRGAGDMKPIRFAQTSAAARLVRAAGIRPRRSGGHRRRHRGQREIPSRRIAFRRRGGSCRWPALWRDQSPRARAVDLFSTLARLGHGGKQRHPDLRATGRAPGRNPRRPRHRGARAAGRMGCLSAARWKPASAKANGATARCGP
jgi:uncharacterized membrane protein YgcG